MDTLTDRQEKILSFIENYREKYSISPSFKEIQDHFSFRSPNAVTKHLKALQKKGYIALNKAKNFTKARGILSLRPGIQDVPLVGKIVAGHPVESIENIEDRINLTFLGIYNYNNQYFALKVRGDSMIDAHILDGDLVVVRKQPDVYEHDVAAVLWNGETTLKYVRGNRTAYSLIPANDSMETIVIDKESAGSFEVLGKVVTVIRQF